MFSGRGFVSKVVRASSDLNTLCDLDGQLTVCVNDMQAGLQVSGLHMQHDMYEDMRRANAAILASIAASANNRSVRVNCK